MDEGMAEELRVRAIYEDGEIIFAEQVRVSGSWRVEVVFLEREDDNMTIESSPHRPELQPVPDRLEEMHRRMEDDRPHTGPYGPYA